jgi:VanZ family protein
VTLRSLNDKRGFVLHVLPALLYSACIFWLGSIHTGISFPQSYLPQDKLNHFGAFGLLTLLAMRALRFELNSVAYGRLIVASIGISSLTGALLEVWQMLFPYRSVEFADWVADTIGALLAGLACLLWAWWRKRHVATG